MTDRYENIRKALDVIDECADGTLLMTRDRCARLREAADTIRLLLEERDALERDAERYQWLRENEQDRADVFLACCRDELDSAIDAAIAAADGGGNV